MQKLSLLIMLGVLFAQTLLADDSFIVYRDGKEYVCRPSNSNPGGAIDCAEKAYNGPFSRDESTALCQGARDVGPADCAIKAYQGPFSRSEALELCRRSGTVSHADCAIKAYQGPYSKAEAIRMCKADPSNMLKMLNLLEVTAPNYFIKK